MLGGELSSGLAFDVGLGGRREVLLLNLSRGRAATVLVDGLLGLGGVLLCKTLDGLGSVGSLLASEVPELSSLLACKTPALLELSVNDLLVLDIDERADVGGDGSNKGKTPHGNELILLLAARSGR